MGNFNLGAVRDWRPFIPGKLLDLPLPENGYRRVTFDVMSDTEVGVHVTSKGEDTWLVGYGAGFFTCSFSTTEHLGLTVVGPDDATILIRTHTETQEVAASDEPSFVTIEPRPAGPSDEIRRLMLLSKINSDRRERALMDEIRALREQGQARPDELPAASDPVIEPAEPPKEPQA